MLATKEGNKEMEVLIGVKLDRKFNTLQYGDLPLPGEPLTKEKSYQEKKKEQDDHDKVIQESTDQLLKKLHDEKKIRKQKKRQERMMRAETERKL